MCNFKTSEFLAFCAFPSSVAKLASCISYSKKIPRRKESQQGNFIYMGGGKKKLEQKLGEYFGTIAEAF